MNQFELPFTTPPAVGLLRWAYTLGISHTEPSTHDWFYSNFIQLTANSDFIERDTELFIDFWRGGRSELNCSNPFLDTRILDCHMMKSGIFSDFHENICELIQKKYYPVLFIDESKISHSVFYGRQSFPHHILIHGFDRVNRTYKIAGFGVVNRERLITKFSHFTVSFSEMEESVTSLFNIVDSGAIHDQLFYFYKLNIDDQIDHPHTYDLDLEFIAQSLSDYIDGRTQIGHENFNLKNDVFGVKIYEALDKYFAACEQGKQVRNRFDTRHIHIIEEHKRIMLARLRHLEEKFPHMNFEQEKNLLDKIISKLFMLKSQCAAHKNELNGVGLKIARKGLSELQDVDKNLSIDILNKLR